jgi:hypothetical protein
MSDPRETKPAIEGDILTTEPQGSKPGTEELSRLTFLGVSGVTPN